MSYADPEKPDALEVGLWCNRCFLPSASRWAYTDGTWDWCADCQSWVDDNGNPIE